MVSALILLGVPVDQEAFDKHFSEVCLPMLQGLPRVERIVTHRVAGAAEGVATLSLLVEARFPDQQAMQEGLNSAAGQEMARELKRSASGGVTVLFCRTTDAALNRPETEPANQD